MTTKHYVFTTLHGENFSRHIRGDLWNTIIYVNGIKTFKTHTQCFFYLGYLEPSLRFSIRERETITYAHHEIN